MAKTLAATGLQRWCEGRDSSADEDLVASEVPVALTINRQSYVVMMATPMDLEDFALGFCLSEGLLRSKEELHSVRVLPREQGLELALTVPSEVAERLASQRRNLTGRTGCGLCGAESLEQAVRPLPPLGQHLRVAHAAVQRALRALPTHQPLQAASGAVHGAAWCRPDGNIELAREDVGRHNALDKLIGALLQAGQDPRTGFLLVSSRASYEMVQKSVLAGVELLAAVSAPTSLAIELASASGLSLLGFTRPGRHNVYTGADRLYEEEHSA